MTDPDTNTIDIVRGAGHTPAPWAVNPFLAQVDGAPATEEGLTPICQLLWPTDVRSEEETQANANLISLAPELAEHVAKIEEWAGRLVLADEAWATPDGLPRMPQELYDEWVQMQDERAALLKALRGEA